MAFRTWAKLLSATLGVGALAGASQLGLAYGLGIVRLTRVLEITDRDQWTAQLAWIAWFPMTAAVAGALAGTAYVRRWAPGFRGGTGTELALAAAAALGAAVVVPLTMQPARTAQVAGVNPVVVIAICAGLGALVGIFAAWAALAQAVARWSLITMGIAVWCVAFVSVMPSLAPSDPLPAVRLGVLDASFLAPAVTQRTALATMPALALLAGAALGWVARRRGLPTLTIALAGLPGPALLTVSYLVAGPGAGADRYQVVPYWAAMTATGAGVLGSVLAAVLRRTPGPADDDAADDTPDSTATPNRPPLPKRGQQESAIAATGVHPAPDPSPTAEVPTPTAARPAAPAHAANPERSAAPAHAASPERSTASARATVPPQAGTAARPPAGMPGPAGTGHSGAADAFTERTDELPSPGAPRGASPGTPRGASPGTPRGASHGGRKPNRVDGSGRHAAPEPTAVSRPLPQPTATSAPLPQPTAASAPLPHPQPVTPPQPMSPPQPVAPRQKRPPRQSTTSPQPTAAGSAPSAPHPAGDPPVGEEDPASGGGRSRKKFGLRRRKDEDYVDWVSGLGK
ncbi:hypothetical protein [Couchioplanes caeruleus]|uniref:Uncharacterized protein n=2 Tax=Couchioplanes caeruleus TaxID=56438 RepID=A0A1K0FZV4_9ACTN|nr:hypothetical protein [Couchioplanes caeruleus]OJF10594.1 hypothetical protein BG844_31180 [Couchioplanes caeruleus subsp. caeruleus]